uniref:Delta-9 desaturase n=1 Tax=Chlamydomonas sp. ICE-L TaxID=309537 RepID=A0A172W5V1_9CHLO|nr:delta-9 desaturase [Chlamydomonas sp. ICE-L]
MQAQLRSSQFVARRTVVSARPALPVLGCSRINLVCKASSSPVPERDVKAKAAASIDIETSIDDELRDITVLPEPAVPKMSDLSYSAQYDQLFSEPKLQTKPCKKPSVEAQNAEEGTKNVLFSEVKAKGKRNLWFNRDYNATDKMFIGFIVLMHAACFLAPATFSWPMVATFFVGYFITGCLGITLSYHRQLSHKSFATPKWLEYTLAYCGVLAAQGDPLEWVSSHRYHHLHCDTPLDPHSPYEGFWWSHAGWLMDNEITIKRVANRNNAADLGSQPFYQHLSKYWLHHVVASFALLFAVGGLPALIWGGCLRCCWVWHVTWFVNSATHVWGTQKYNTGDLSRNNWWVGILAFGEGWHNNHHAFEFSARHGLEWYQLDVTYMLIKALQTVGLAKNVKLPTEAQKARLAFPDEPKAVPA